MPEMIAPALGRRQCVNFDHFDHLGRVLPDTDALPLLDFCAAVRDPAPLAWLARRRLDDGWLARLGALILPEGPNYGLHGFHGLPAGYP